MLYLLKAYLKKGKEIFKLGFTDKDIKYRLSQYQSHCPGVELISTRGGDRDLELAMHLYLHSLPYFKFVKDEWYIGSLSELQKIFHISELSLMKRLWKNRNITFDVLRLASKIKADSSIIKLYDRLKDLFGINKSTIIDEKIYKNKSKNKHNIKRINYYKLRNDTNCSQKITSILEQFDNYSQFTDKMRVLATSNLSEEELESILSQIPSEYSNYFSILGKERISACGYQRSRLDKEINDNSIISAVDLVKDVNSTFAVGERYSRVFIKNKLQEIYSKHNLNKIAKAMDLNRYFDIKPCQINYSGGRREPAILILKIK